MSPLLLIHILGGVFSIGAVFASWIVLVRNRKKSYPFFLKTLSVLTSFEILSGTLLAYFSPSVSAQSLCVNLALYLTVIAVTYAGFVYRMKLSSSSIFQQITPALGSLAVFVLVLVQGV